MFSTAKAMLARMFHAGILLTAAAGSSSCGSPDPEHEEALGEVQLRLVTTDGGKTFRLRGTFVVRGGYATDSPQVTSFSSETDPNAESLSVRLPRGNYVISLQPGWRLEVHAEDGTWRPTIVDVVASSSDAFVQIYPGRVTTTRFHFVVTNAIDERQGTLVVDLQVDQRPGCGNHVVEPDEVCDDGIYNGQVGRCDASCRFVCTGACPLRVIPGTGYPIGNGHSWNAPNPSIQSAIDQQAALGGGQVWILGGDFNLPSDPASPITLRSNVSVLGGFQGSETSPEERAPDAPLTTLRDPRPNMGDLSAPTYALESVGQTNVLIENLRLITEHSEVLIEAGRSVLFRNITIEGPFYVGPSEVRQSEVRFEASHFTTGWEVRDSDVVFVDTLLAEGYYGFIDANKSRILLERVDSVLPLYIHDGSQVLIKDTTLRGRFDRGGVLVVERGPDSDSLAAMATLMDAQVLVGGAQSPLLGGSLFVWNSSFVNMQSGSAGGYRAAAAAIESDDLEVAASTFFNNICAESSAGPCWQDVTTNMTSLIHNTLFVQTDDLPFLGPPELEQLPSPIKGDPRTSGICITQARDQFQVSGGQVLALTHPCMNVGDATELEASRQRLLARISPFIGAPFSADVSRYQSADWWRTETVLAAICTDQGAPDPGRHYPLTCEAPSP